MYFKYRIKFLRENWKLCIHLLLKTRRFGMNNKRWSSFPSCFGDSLWKIAINMIRMYPIARNYKLVKIRATKLGALHPDTVEKLGWKTNFKDTG